MITSSMNGGASPQLAPTGSRAPGAAAPFGSGDSAVGSVGGIDRIGGGGPARSGDGVSPGGSFSDVLKGALDGAHAAEQSANDMASRFAAGDPTVGIHEAVIAAEKANISVHYAVTLKNRAIEAYRDLMNTPV